MQKATATTSLFAAFQARITLLRRQGRHTTAAHFGTALSRLSHYRGGSDLPLPDIDAGFCLRFERFLLAGGVCRNTASQYMRCLRAIYNGAAERGPAARPNPFTHVFTGNEPTRKRALTAAELRRLRRLDLAATPPLEFARDMFLFSLYCRGMSLVDMAGLRKSDISGSTLTYRRSKTGGLLRIAYTGEIREIVRRHTREASPFLLPLRSPSASTRPGHKTAGCRLNRALARVAALAGISRRFTMYAARHSWATLARDAGIPIHVIKEALGHASLQTTQIYLATLAPRLIDEANRRVINALMVGDE